MEDAPKKVRRYDIDWLRVILFALLIPFHVGIGVYWGAYDFVQPEHSVEEDAKREDLNADAGEEAINVYSFLGGGVISYISPQPGECWNRIRSCFVWRTWARRQTCTKTSNRRTATDHYQ